MDGDFCFFSSSPRRKNTGIPVNTMIKPSTGITPEQGAELFYLAASGGTDIIKDDEVLGDTDFSPMLKRVKLFMKNAQRAYEETGQKSSTP
jgi:2,3-diketo-5-methylthiopentyl-1-phosphate enolase